MFLLFLTIFKKSETVMKPCSKAVKKKNDLK